MREERVHKINVNIYYLLWSLINEVLILISYFIN